MGLSFEDWYRAHYRPLLASIVVLAGDVDAAQDVTDEAFARAVSRWGRVSGMQSPVGWTYRVAVHLLRRRQRRAAVERRLLGRLRPLSQALLPSATYEMWSVVMQLPPRQRTAVTLRYLGGLTEEETAVAMGVRTGTASATLAQARRRLADLLATEPDSKQAHHD
jgi:RNA polymerase sigma-70 factor (ECF subfamily)